MDLAMQKLLQQQLGFMELFTERLCTPQQASQETKLCALEDSESVRRSITEFLYDMDVKLTFPKWFSCYEDLFTVDLKEQVNDWKVGLLLRNLVLAEHDQYLNYILPKHPWPYNFAETVEILKQIFGESASLFNIHFNCLNTTKCNAVDFTTYAGTINKKWFKILSITDA